MTPRVASGRVYVLRWCGPDHGGREWNPPRIPACGSPLDPVGDVHPGTRSTGPRVCWRTSARSGISSAMRAADRPSRSNAMSPRFARSGKPLWIADAHRVTAGRESLPNTAHPRREAPMTAAAVAGASLMVYLKVRNATLAPGLGRLHPNDARLRRIAQLGGSPEHFQPIARHRRCPRRRGNGWCGSRFDARRPDGR